MQEQSVEKIANSTNSEGDDSTNVTSCEVAPLRSVSAPRFESRCVVGLNDVSILLKKLEAAHSEAKGLSGSELGNHLLPLYVELDKAYGLAIVEIVGEGNKVYTHSFPSTAFSSPSGELKFDSFLNLLWGAASAKDRFINCSKLIQDPENKDYSRLEYPIAPGNVLDMFGTESGQYHISSAPTMCLHNYCSYITIRDVWKRQLSGASFHIPECPSSFERRKDLEICSPHDAYKILKAEWVLARLIEQLIPKRMDRIHERYLVEECSNERWKERFKIGDVLKDYSKLLSKYGLITSKSYAVASVFEAEYYLRDKVLNEDVKVIKSPYLTSRGSIRNSFGKKEIRLALQALCIQEFGEFTAENAARLQEYFICNSEGKDWYAGYELLGLARLEELDFSKIIPITEIPSGSKGKPEVAPKRGEIIVNHDLGAKILKLEKLLGIRAGKFGDPSNATIADGWFEQVHDYVSRFKNANSSFGEAIEADSQLDNLVVAYSWLIYRCCEIRGIKVSSLTSATLQDQPVVVNDELKFDSFQDIIGALSRVSYAAKLLAGYQKAVPRVSSLDINSFSPGHVIFNLQHNIEALRPQAIEPQQTTSSSRSGLGYQDTLVADFHLKSMQRWKIKRPYHNEDLNVVKGLSVSEMERTLKEYYEQSCKVFGYCYLAHPHFGFDLEELGRPGCAVSSMDLMSQYTERLKKQGKLKSADVDSMTAEAEYYFRVRVLNQDPARLLYAPLSAEGIYRNANGDEAFGLLQYLCQREYKEFSPESVQKLSEAYVSNLERNFWVSGRELVMQAGERIRFIGSSPTNSSPTTNVAAPASREEARNEVLKKVVVDVEVPMGALLQALSALNVVKKTPRAFGDLARIIRPDKDSEKREKFRGVNSVELFENVLSFAEGKINTGRAAVSRLTDLLNQICVRNHDGDIPTIIVELESYLKSETSNEHVDLDLEKLVRSKIIPALLQRYNQVSEFKHPSSVKPRLFVLQIEALLDALHFGRPIKIMGTGSGKTETAAVYCETLIEREEASGALWVTKVSSRVGAATRLRETILSDDLRDSVVVLGPEGARMNEKDFRDLLRSHRYVVAGADTLADLKKYNPQNYAVLQEWVRDKIEVLDEFHILDKHTTQRYQAINDLAPRHVLSLSATPFQHDEERIATILHLNLPEEYPDVRSLMRSMRDNPHLAEELLRAHSTIFELEDIARYFEDPSAISFEDQLSSGLPRMPRAKRSILKVPLSKLQTEKYVDIATNWAAFDNWYSRWAAKCNEMAGSIARRIPESISQADALRRIIGDPESIDAGPPLALVEGVKEAILPLLSEGKKVVVAAENRSLLRFLHADPEIQMYMDGVPILDGDISPERRFPEIRRFEEDPKVQCVIGQVDAIGSSDNFRSADMLVIVQRPKTIAGGIQLEGRVSRAIVSGEERFARLGVDIVYVEPTLNQSVIDGVKERKRREVLNRGSVYEIWLDKYIKRLERYKLFTARSASSKSSTFSSTKDLLDAVKTRYRAVVAQHRHYDLLSQRTVAERAKNYRTEAKRQWREEFLEINIRQHLEFLGKEPKDLKVALLPGPEGLELDVYLRLGVLPENIYCFEGSTNRDLVNAARKRVVEEGCRFYSSRIESVLPRLEVAFDLVSIDLDGYITPRVVDLFIKLPVADRTLIAVNSLGRRESGESGEILDLFAGDRFHLQKAMLKMASTFGRNPHVDWQGKRALMQASNARNSARVLARVLGEAFDLDVKLLTELFGELYIGSMHIHSIDQHSYAGSSGNPFVSTFGALSSWDPEIREGAFAQVIRKAMQDVFTAGYGRGKRISVSDLHLSKDGDGVHVYLGDTLIGQVLRSDLESLISYFSVMVEEPYRLPSLLKN